MAAAVLPCGGRLFCFVKAAIAVELVDAVGIAGYQVHISASRIDSVVIVNFARRIIHPGGWAIMAKRDIFRYNAGAIRQNNV